MLNLEHAFYVYGPISDIGLPYGSMWNLHFNRHLVSISTGGAFKCRTTVVSMLGTIWVQIPKTDFVTCLSTVRHSVKIDAYTPILSQSTALL